MSEPAGDAAGDDFTFLHQDSLTVPASPTEVFAAVEADDQRGLLGLLSDRFVDREILERTATGYRCRTVSRASLGRRRSFESAVALDEPHRSVEVQFGERTDLRYTTTYEAAGDGAGTRVVCEQAYRPKRSSMESGAAITRLRRRAEEVLAARLDAVRRLAG